MIAPPPGVRDRVWIVVRSNGEHYFVEKEPLEGILGWALGQNVIVLEYAFARVTYRAAPEAIEAP